MTKLGWTLAGKQGVSGNFAEKEFFVRSGKDEFEQIYFLDALGIKDEKSEATDFRQRYNDPIVPTKDGFMKHHYHGIQTDYHYLTAKNWLWENCEVPQKGEKRLIRWKNTIKS